MRLLVPALLVMLCGTILTACETTPTTATTGHDAVRVACSAFMPVYYSARDDSELTVSQIRRHNSVWRSLCADDPQP